jgi:hypothetical protein
VEHRFFVERGVLMRTAPARPLGLALLLLAGSVLVGAQSAAERRVFPDDPLSQEPETQDASGAASADIELAPDLLLNLFTRPGDPAPHVRAGNVNTIDEVPDSGWFTNRIYARPLGVDEIVRGPNVAPPPAPGPWTIVSAKTSGVSPGFTARDSRGVRWFVQFDAAGHPGAATSAVAVATRLFWALGYNQIETHLVALRRDDLKIDDKATIETRATHRRPLRNGDVDDVLARAARSADGTYRATAGLSVPGRVIGPFKYYGTRSDDPNDVVAHEHRRELRALKVFGAWTNLVDMKAGNTLDTVVDVEGRAVVRHYLQDVGSTFGTGAQGPREWDEGYEYLYEGTPMWKRLVSFGFFLRPWQTIPYQELPEIGRFEGDRFDPTQWRPRVPTAAILRADASDTFWAALRVAAFSNELIRAAVKQGQYEDASAERLLRDVLVKRRDRIARAYLRQVSSLTHFALDSQGRLTFTDAAVAAGVAPAGEGFEAQWFRYANDTDATEAIGASRGRSALEAPSPLPVADGAIVKITIAPTGADAGRPVDVYFRHHADGWRLVGIDRIRS